MSKKKILLNAFNMNCIGHINHGLWTHPRDTSTRYNAIEYWTELAQLLDTLRQTYHRRRNLMLLLNQAF